MIVSQRLRHAAALARAWRASRRAEFSPTRASLDSLGRSSQYRFRPERASRLAFAGCRSYGARMPLRPADSEALERLVADGIWMRLRSIKLDEVDPPGGTLCVATFTGLQRETIVVEYWPLASSSDKASPPRAPRHLLLRISGSGWLCGPLEGRPAAKWLQQIPTAFIDCEVLVTRSGGPGRTAA